jgi:NAD(P)-dependent dehydrogenase (short-subunit alcohol dehydrogenase family)
MNMFKDKVALITGAASGIGRDTAIAFAEKGAAVVISDVDADGLEETAKRIKDKEGEVTVIITDVSKEPEVKSMIEKIVDTYGRLDVACNNAGVGGELAPTADYTSEQWDRVINVNLRGQWLCMKYQIPAMLNNEGGSIVNIASILGKVGFANAPAYVASKHGLVGLTKAASLEYSSQGVRVNAVAPAFIETAMLEQAGLTTDPEKKQMLVNMHPIGRLGQPREVADAIVWIASDEASFVTGHTLLVDGGYISQ